MRRFGGEHGLAVRVLVPSPMGGGPLPTRQPSFVYVRGGVGMSAPARAALFHGGTDLKPMPRSSIVIRPNAAEERVPGLAANRTIVPLASTRFAVMNVAGIRLC